MKRAWILVACLSAGCLLLDDRELRIEPAGVLFAGVGGQLDRTGKPVFVFQVRSASREVDLEVDGEPVGRALRADTRIELPTDDLSPGPHLLSVRERDVAVPRTLERTLAYYPETPEVVAVSPPPEAGARDQRFTARITFSVPLVPELVRDHAWLEAGGARLATRPRLAASGRAVELDLPSPVPSFGVVTARVSPGAFALPGGAGWDAVWSAELLRARIVVPAYTTALRGLVPVTVETVPGSTYPPVTELLADDQLIATFVAAPAANAWNATWNTAALPDGQHTLGLRVSPGSHFAYEAPPPIVRTDNVPPVLQDCKRTADLSEACWRLGLDSPGAIRSASLTVGGTTLPMSPGGAGWCANLREGYWDPLTPPAFDPVTMDGEAVIEAIAYDSGQRTAVSTCRIALPPWEADWGEPLAGVAAQGAVSFASSSFCGYWLVDGVWKPVCPIGRGTLLAIGRSGGDAGKVLIWTLAADGTWSKSAPLNLRSGSIAQELVNGWWIERVGGGPGLVFTRGSGPANLDPLRDAGGLTSTGDGALAGSFAWTEEATTGRALVVYRSAQNRIDPAAMVEAVGVHTTLRHPFYPVPFFATFAAWTERLPGGTAQLRSADIDSYGVLSFHPELVNADPASSAADPSAFVNQGGYSVAWREGDQVLARVLTVNGATEAFVLNADPARPARQPRFDLDVPRPIVYWIERNGGVDEIRARRWDGNGWLLYPQPVNGPAPGQVVSFTVSSQVLAWVDELGRVHVRFPNFPP